MCLMDSTDYILTIVMIIICTHTYSPYHMQLNFLIFTVDSFLLLLSITISVYRIDARIISKTEKGNP